MKRLGAPIALAMLVTSSVAAATARAQPEAAPPATPIVSPATVTTEVTSEAAPREGRLHVESVPTGATVLVDRAAFGTTPVTGVLPAGLHYVVITLPTYFTERRDVVIGEAPVELAVAFTPDPALQPRGANAPMIVGGSVLALGGIAGIVLAVVGATGDRHCSARCDESGGRHVVERPAIDSVVAWSVAGGISLVVGTVLIVIGATAGGPARSSVALTGDGLAVAF